jgi:hypothetical protein
MMGANHYRLADAFYALGEAQLHYSKRVEALSSFKRAYQIIRQHNKTDTQAFVEAGLKVAQLCLASSSLMEALQTAETVFETA